ncbi:hypothetical protein C8Q76DRAFT_792193 [Earliella scabrosa]|nr:hypothetical protein C8Q76DRAFT_792193 [Earliella scabrosa]
MTQQPSYFYRVPSNILTIRMLSSDYLGQHYTEPNPTRLHWRPELHDAHIVALGLAQYQPRFPNQDRMPTSIHLVLESPAPLSTPLIIANRFTGDMESIIVLDTPGDVTSNNEVVVYGWELSNRHTISAARTPFFSAINCIMPATSLRLPLVLSILLWLSCTTLARLYVHVYYRLHVLSARWTSRVHEDEV